MKSDLHNKPTILAADDELELLKLLQMMMPLHGYNVNISHCAENIFDMIHESVPDIIFLDVNMGKVDGSVVCALLKAASKVRPLRQLPPVRNHPCSRT